MLTNKYHIFDFGLGLPFSMPSNKWPQTQGLRMTLCVLWVRSLGLCELAPSLLSHQAEIKMSARSELIWSPGSHPCLLVVGRIQLHVAVRLRFLLSHWLDQAIPAKVLPTESCGIAVGILKTSNPIPLRALAYTQGTGWHRAWALQELGGHLPELPSTDLIGVHNPDWFILLFSQLCLEIIS